jgi:hypothetical protein
VAVLTAVRVSITDDVVFVVIDGEVAINLVGLVDSIGDAVLICAEDCWIVFIAVFSDVLLSVCEILTNEESNSSVGATDKCHDWIGPLRSNRKVTYAGEELRVDALAERIDTIERDVDEEIYHIWTKKLAVYNLLSWVRDNDDRGVEASWKRLTTSSLTQHLGLTCKAESIS